MEENSIEQTEETVGEMLRKSRLKQGKTLSDAAEELCIRKFYINAIENMDIANFPPLTYALGFIRSYAKYLNLNDDRIVALYRQAMNGDNDEKHSSESPKMETPAPRLKHIILSLIGIAIIFVAWSVLPISKTVDDYPLEEEITVPKPEIITETVIPENKADAQESEEETKEKATDAEQDKVSEDDDTPSVSKDAQKKSEEEIKEKSAKTDVKHQPKLRLVLTGPSWLEIRQGDKTIISGVHKKGFEYDFPAEKGQIITVGRPRDAHFYLDGKEIIVATAVKRKNLSLDKYFEPQE